MDGKKLSRLFCLLLLFAFSKAIAGDEHFDVKNILKEILQQNVGANFNGARISTGCEDMNIMPDLDATRLFRGKIWYEMEKSESEPGKPDDCAETVTMKLTGSQTLYFGFEYKNPKDGLDLFGSIDTSDQNNTFVTINKPQYLKGSTFHILDTDYDNYTLLYSCSSEKKENFWILTRQKDPSDSLRELIQNAIYQQSKDFQEKLSSMNKCEEIHNLNTCRNKTNMAGLDLSKLAEESWFEQVRSSNDWEGNDICANVNFTYDDQKTFTVLYENQGKQVKYQPLNIVKNGDDLLFSTSDDNFFFYITGTDYKNYTIIYSCDQISKSEKEERLWILGKYNKISEDIIDAVSKEYEGISVKNITCPLPPPTTTVQPVTTTTPESVATNPTSVTSTPNDNDNNNETTTSAEDITTLDPGDDKGFASELVPCLLTSLILSIAVALLF